MSFIQGRYCHQCWATFSGNPLRCALTTRGIQVSSKGKVKHRSASRGHRLSHKSGKQKRQLRKDGALTPADAKEVRENLAPGS